MADSQSLDDHVLLTGLSEISSAVREAAQVNLPGQAALDSALIALVDAAGKTDEAQALQQALLEPVVYLVANYVPISAQSDAPSHQRLVAAAANRRLFKPPAGASYVLIPEERRPSLSFFGNGPSLDEERATRLWIRRWHDYLGITSYGNRLGLQTWNQFLLTATGLPHELGVSWGSIPENGLPRYYTRADSSVFELLALPCPAQEDDSAWKLDTWRTSPTPFDRTYEQHPAISHLLERCRDLQPQGEWTSDRVAWALSELLRSYALWGGNSFLSIPFAFGGKDSPELTCVLSVCTSRPLDGREVLRWRFVGREVFQPLIARETEDLLRDDLTNRAYVQSTYGIGHALKNRVMPLRKEIEFAKSLATTAELHEALDRVDQLSEALRGFGTLLNFFSQARKAGEAGISALGRDVVTHTTLRLGTRMKQLLTNLRPTGLRAHVAIVTEMNGDALDSVVLKPFAYNPKLGQNVRPLDGFYEELLWELCVNAANYAPLRDERVEIGVAVLEDGSIEISNLFPRSQRGDRFPKIPPGMWADWPTPDCDGGGLFYAALALQMTNTGTVSVRWEPEGEADRFSVRMTLLGIMLSGGDKDDD